VARHASGRLAALDEPFPVPELGDFAAGPRDSLAELPRAARPA